MRRRPPPRPRASYASAVIRDPSRAATHHPRTPARARVRTAGPFQPRRSCSSRRRFRALPSSPYSTARRAVPERHPQRTHTRWSLRTSRARRLLPPRKPAPRACHRQPDRWPERSHVVIGECCHGEASIHHEHRALCAERPAHRRNDEQAAKQLPSSRVDHATVAAWPRAAYQECPGPSPFPPSAPRSPPCRPCRASPRFRGAGRQPTPPAAAPRQRQTPPCVRAQ